MKVMDGKIYPYTRAHQALKAAEGLMRDMGRTQDVVQLQAMIERLERDHNN